LQHFKNSSALCFVVPSPILYIYYYDESRQRTKRCAKLLFLKNVFSPPTPPITKPIAIPLCVYYNIYNKYAGSRWPMMVDAISLSFSPHHFITNKTTRRKKCCNVCGLFKETPVLFFLTLFQIYVKMCAQVDIIIIIIW